MQKSTIKLEYSTDSAPVEKVRLLNLYDQLVEQSLQFYYNCGAVSVVSTGEIAPWRTMPYGNVAHVSGGVWKIEREDVGEFLVQSGQACYIPAGVRHRSFMVSPGRSQARWAHFNVFLCGYIDVFSFFEMPSVFQGESAARLGEILSRLTQFYATDGPFSFLLQRKILELELAAALLAGAAPNYQADGRLLQIQRVLPVLKIIHDDSAQPHTRESLAAAIYLSPSRFGAIFREATGLSPIDYILKLRMQRARHLLTDGALSIEEIAHRVGYRDAFYFSRLFKTHFGFSPKNYRQMALQ